jgi:CRISPR-associated protein Cas1
MLNQFVYCRRLFYLEWVEGLWDENADTADGRQRTSVAIGVAGGFPLRPPTSQPIGRARGARSC